MTTPKAPERGLVFQESTHKYRLDGKPVEGVTTLIKGGLRSARSVAEYVAANPERVNDLRMMGTGPMVAALKEVPWQERDTAAAKGTEIHDFAERIMKGEVVHVPVHLTGYVEACLAFFDEWDIEPVLVEAVVGNREHQYAGKLDLIADHNRGLRAIFDYKTSRSGIWPETAFQEAAYAFCEFYGELGDEHPMPKVYEAYGVHLRDGEYDCYPLEFGPHVFDEFLTIAAVARIAKRAKGNKTTLGYVGLPVQPLEEAS
jgi:hypothetical protein